VLDLDDTLFLERDYVRSGFRAVGAWAHKQLSIDDFAERALRQFESGRRGDIFNIVLRECGYPECSDYVQTMLRVYREHDPAIFLLPDAVQFLTQARTWCRLALISDGPLESQRRKFSALGLKRFFNHVIFTDAWGAGYSKPHQRAFKSVQRRFGPCGTQYYYIGDNPHKDFVTPRALGWKTVRIRRPAGIYSMYEGQRGYQAHIEVSSLRKLIPVLCKGF